MFLNLGEVLWISIQTKNKMLLCGHPRICTDLQLPQGSNRSLFEEGAADMHRWYQVTLSMRSDTKMKVCLFLVGASDIQHKMERKWLGYMLMRLLAKNYFMRLVLSVILGVI